MQSWDDIGRKNIDDIVKAFTHERHLLPIRGHEIRESLEKGLAILAIHGQELVGFSRLIPLTDTWFELGSTWVRKDFRGHALNKRMYQDFLPLHMEKNILATTTNPASVAVGESLGFVQIARKSLPEHVWRATCICPTKKTRVSDNAFCALAWSESHAVKLHCFTRVTTETWARRKSWLV